MELVADYRHVGGSYGGYNEDHELLRTPPVDLTPPIAVRRSGTAAAPAEARSC